MHALSKEQVYSSKPKGRSNLLYTFLSCFLISANQAILHWGHRQVAHTVLFIINCDGNQPKGMQTQHLGFGFCFILNACLHR